MAKFEEDAERAFEEWWTREGILNVPFGLHANGFGPVKEQARIAFAKGAKWADERIGEMIAEATALAEEITETLGRTIAASKGGS